MTASPDTAPDSPGAAPKPIVSTAIDSALGTDAATATWTFPSPQPTIHSEIREAKVCEVPQSEDMTSSAAAGFGIGPGSTNCISDSRLLERAERIEPLPGRGKKVHNVRIWPQDVGVAAMVSACRDIGLAHLVPVDLASGVAVDRDHLSNVTSNRRIPSSRPQNDDVARGGTVGGRDDRDPSLCRLGRPLVGVAEHSRQAIVVVG